MYNQQSYIKQTGLAVEYKHALCKQRHAYDNEQAYPTVEIYLLQKYKKIYGMENPLP